MENIYVKEIVYKVYFLDKQYNFYSKKISFTTLKKAQRFQVRGRYTKSIKRKKSQNGRANFKDKLFDSLGKSLKCLY